MRAAGAAVTRAKPLLALVLAATLCLGAVACGGTHAASATSTSGGYLKNDADKDTDDPGHHVPGAKNDDLQLFAIYGTGASPADTRAIADLVKAYYAASYAGEGAKACSMLYSSLAAGLGQSRQDCTATMSRLLAQQHPHLVAENPASMLVLGVHVKGETGLAVLGFKTMPESNIVLQREGHAWKIDALFDTVMT
jgi:hypothetical protein